MRRVRRETREHVRECGRLRPMVFEFDPATGHLECWPKGTRRRAVVPLVATWQRAMQRAAEEKRGKRKRRKG